MAGKSMRGGLAAVFVAVVAGIMFAGYNYLLLRKRKREEEGADGIPPDVKLLQEDPVIVVEGDTCQLEAELTGDPDPKAIWFQDGREIKESSLFKITREDNKSILCCQNVETGMAGKYTIKAANAFGVAKASTKVYVDKGGVPPAFETKPEPVGVLEGEHCLLEVEVTGDPAPTVQWFKDNQEITDCFEYKIITKGNKSMLVIDKADVSMGGAYVVKATNKAGSEECSSLLSVKKAGKPPVFESKLSFKPLKVKEGEKCSMEVVVSGYPAPTVTWFKDNQEIVESSLYKFVQEDDKAILVIERAELDIGGAYVVKATNEHGAVECNTDLTIQKAAKIPSFTQELKPLTVKEKESCRLEVEVEGEPMPKVTWFKDGDQILDTAAFMANGKKFALAIDSVSLNMGGSYMVRAENEAGSKECQAQLTVEKVAIAPSFSKELKPLTVKEKETCRLDVEVEGDPVPKVTWFRDGDQILDIANYKFINDGKKFTLLIDSASPDMSGAYKARAENEAGSVASQAQLTIEKAGQAPEFTSKLQPFTIKKGDSCEMMVEFLGDPVPLVTWFKDGEQIWDTSVYQFLAGNKKCSLVIQSAELEMSGTYKVQATNDFGSVECETLLKVVEE